MKLTFDKTLSIEVSPAAIGCLKAFAQEVMKLAQEDNPENASDWTACGIWFHGFSPEFTYGDASEMMCGDFDLFVEMPIDRTHTPAR